MVEENKLQPFIQESPTVAFKYKWWLLLGGVLIIAWFALGIYLHQQVVQSRARVAQSKIEDARRQEFLRRGAQYKQDLRQRTQTPQTRNVFDGR